MASSSSSVSPDLTETNEQLRQLVVPLMAVTLDAKWHPIGTAFIVGTCDRRNAWAITAAHNLEYVKSLAHRGIRSHATTPSDFISSPNDVALGGTKLHALAYRRGVIDVATMERAWYRGGIDVALILLSLPSDSHCEFDLHLAIDSTPHIEIGSQMFAAGYAGLEADFAEPPDYDAERLLVTTKTPLSYRSGTVLELVRGAGIFTDPGMFVSCAFDSGMSGGPVFEVRDGKPFVRGVVGGDLSEDPQNGAVGSVVRAFAGMIWPATALRATSINIQYSDGMLESDPLVLDLIKRGVIEDAGRAHEHVVVQDRDGQFRASWQ